MSKTIKEVFGDVDGICGWRTPNSIGLSRYKNFGDFTVIADVYHIKHDNSLRDVCDELDIFWEGDNGR